MKKRAVKESLNQKLLLGISLLVVGVILMSGKVSPNIVQSDSFESEPVKISGFSNSEMESKDLPARIIIPGLGIDIDVLPARLINGYWEVFESSAGWGEGSGLPGRSGNQVIFAHARDGLFKPLKDAEVGMRVYILSEGNWYSYKIKEIKEVSPNKTEVIAPTDNEVLTLYTCSGFTDSKRLIVVTERT